MRIDLLVFGVICGLIGMGIGAAFGWNDGFSAAQREAITVGTATWVPDDEGRPVFKWNLKSETKHYK